MTQEYLFGILRQYEAELRCRGVDSPENSLSTSGRITLAGRILLSLKRLSPSKPYLPGSIKRLNTSGKGVSVQHGHERATSGSTLVYSSIESSTNLIAYSKCSTSNIKLTVETTMEQSEVPGSLKEPVWDSLKGPDQAQQDKEHAGYLTHLPFDSLGLRDTERLKEHDCSQDEGNKLDLDTASTDALKALLKKNRERYKRNLTSAIKHYRDELQCSHEISRWKHHSMVVELKRALKMSEKNRVEARHHSSEFERKNECLRIELQAMDTQLDEKTSLAENYRIAYTRLLEVNANLRNQMTDLETLLHQKYDELSNAELNISDLNNAIVEDKNLITYMDDLLRTSNARLNDFQRDSVEKSDALQGLAMLLGHNSHDIAGMKRSIKEKNQKCSDLQKEVGNCARELRSVKMRHAIEQEDAARKLEHLESEVERKDDALQKADSVKNEYQKVHEDAMGRLNQRLPDDNLNTISASHQGVLEDNSTLSHRIAKQEQELILAKAQVAPLTLENRLLKSKHDLLLQEKAAADNLIASLQHDLKEGFAKHQQLIQAKDHEIAQRDLAIKDASSQMAAYRLANANGRERLAMFADNTFIAYQQLELNRVSKAAQDLWVQLSQFQKKQDEEIAAKESADRIQDEEKEKRIGELELEAESLWEMLDVKNAQGDLE